MSKNRTPPRIASWMLRHNEAMLGDIQEQFARGKSRFWFWQEVIAAIFTGAYTSILSRRSLTMKRTVVWTAALVAVFLLGYWTARSPLIVHEEMPSAELIADMKVQRHLADAYKRQKQREGTAFFLKVAVRAAELEYNKSRTAASKEKLDELRQGLEQAERRKQDNSTWLDRWVER